MGKRNPNFDPIPQEFYSTPRNISQTLLNGPPLPHTLWECAAGDGAMVDVLREGGHTVLASDISPRRDDITKLDFFNVASLPAEVGAIVTNPPWTHTAKLLDHAFTHFPATPIIFLLKGQWLHVQANMRFFPYLRATGPITIRPKWFPGSRDTAKDDVSWFQFSGRPRAKDQQVSTFIYPPPDKHDWRCQNQKCRAHLKYKNPFCSDRCALADMLS